MKKIAYANAVADDKVRRYVPPVRVVRESAGVSDSAALLDGVHTQSFVHFNPRECVLPPGGEIILDFGLELHGLLTVTTGCMKLSRARITFGESVSETLGTPTQDHAIHQELLSLPQLGQVNFGQTAFRFVRATEGTGGLGSLRLDDLNSYKSWLFINSSIPEFTVSEFLTGRHLANQMLYYNGEYVKGAALECVEYVMANTAPSHVTGNTHFGRFLNEDRINSFCDNCIKYLEKKLGVPAHGIFSFDLKEDSSGNMKVTEINIRHMAYTGVMAQVGFDLIEDTIKIMENGNSDGVNRDPFHHYDKPYVFLRDVDVEPIVLESEEMFEQYNVIGR